MNNEIEIEVYGYISLFIMLVRVELNSDLGLEPDGETLVRRWDSIKGRRIDFVIYPS